MGPVQTPKLNNSKLPDGVQMVKSDISGLECPWYLVCGEMVWSKKEGWKSYYEGNRDDCYFKSTEEAIEAWENAGE